MPCITLDCPVLYKLSRVNRHLSRGPYLRQLLEQFWFSDMFFTLVLNSHKLSTALSILSFVKVLSLCGFWCLHLFLLYCVVLQHSWTEEALNIEMRRRWFWCSVWICPVVLDLCCHLSIQSLYCHMYSLKLNLTCAVAICKSKIFSSDWFFVLVEQSLAPVWLFLYKLIFL